MTMQGKCVLITGASKGIGAAAAKVFAEAGANVALVARNRDAIADLAGEIGPSAIAIPCDVSRYWEMEAAVEACHTAFGQLDVLINNAGVIEPIAGLIRRRPRRMGACHRHQPQGRLQRHARRPARHDPAPLRHHPHRQFRRRPQPAGRLERLLHLQGGGGDAHPLRRSRGARRGAAVMGLSPGTVATDMQREIKASGVNPVSALDWSDHIPADWPARALLWMCSPEADEFLGQEISLRDEDIRRRIGLA